MAKAKTMNRSRNQLATAYAPESFFTFEGGMGACIARSSAGEPIQLSESTMDLVFERMNELGRAWFNTALSARDGDPAKPRILPTQCVDQALLDPTRTEFQLPGQERFYLCRPSHMEYTPAPLTFVCRTCGMFQDYETLAELDANLWKLNPNHCPNPKKKGQCDWEQLDVIFVHWSGHWEGAFPGQWHWSDRDARAIKRRDSCVCGSHQFKLNRRSAGIGDWFFECAACDKPLSPKWLQNDRDTLRILGLAMGPDRLTEVRMQATPYRASSAYYVKSDLFIDFKDGSQQLLTRLRPGREVELKDFVAKQYGFAIQPITDENVKKACEGKPECTKDLADYLAAVEQIRVVEPQLETYPEPLRATMRNLLDLAYNNQQRILDDLRQRLILLSQVDLPASVVSNLQNRQSMFASKFDPFRLAVEHAALKSTRLDVETRTNGKKQYVSFTRLDEDLAPEDKDNTDQVQTATRVLLDKLGLEDMGLIREFDLCRFSFGYSRMESTPILRDKRGMDMPVRLNLFPPVGQSGSTKYPVYVVQQGNEALYVRLKEEVVLEWLHSLKCPDMFSLNVGEKIGAGLLGAAQPMSPFLDNLPETTTPPVYFYLYTLLHSYSHLLMKHVSEYSGLDLGSLGEYIFPADLAFVVYRNGTTMDLGNLSSLWRNSGTAMLTAMLSSKATQCGTGSLCTERGGACPDCVMMPETSCIVSNKLLSRSVLRSIGGVPRFDKQGVPINGYLDIAAR
ncbi:MULTISPECIES: hypothetical protein [Aeromonas]|nr:MULTISPECIES: hypothetical protein [Aeromonas]MCX0425020.1 hypothetical protein [Aeromonas veronii]MCX0448513.1 hypothetical protein [Aeromonas veronii]MDX7780210.1 hypothetical protein [Aeromonas hydrophila]POG19736.1 hypothetical protein C2849_06110 [Aeromonas veronii]